jgi:hypothetical protein
MASLELVWSCQSSSSSLRKIGARVIAGCLFTNLTFSVLLGRASGRKSGAVRRIAFLKLFRGSRSACIRPSSSGVPSTRYSTERANEPISRSISPTGSEDGGLGSRERSWVVRSNNFSSSSSSSGSLPKPFNRLSDFSVARTYRLAIKLDRSSPRRRVSFSVPKRCWYSQSKLDQGALVEKNSASFRRACS